MRGTSWREMGANEPLKRWDDEGASTAENGDLGTFAVWSSLEWRGCLASFRGAKRTAREALGLLVAKKATAGARTSANGRSDRELRQGQERRQEQARPRLWGRFTGAHLMRGAVEGGEQRRMTHMSFLPCPAFCCTHALALTRGRR